MAGLPLRWLAPELILAPQTITARLAGNDVPMLGFNGSLPGPEIRVSQGQTARITLDNRLEEGALVHWHGLRVPNDMDGVNVLTQDVVIPGHSYRYQFAVPDAGTYWYHSHYLSYDQVSRGLFGAFIVEEQNAPTVDHDIVVQFFDVLLDHSGQYDEAFDPAQFATEGRIGNMVAAFVPSGPGNTVKRGGRLRLRLINPSIDRVYRVDLDGLAGKIVALDGMPLAHPRKLEPILLAPGQRCDVIGDATGPIRVQGQLWRADAKPWRNHSFRFPRTFEIAHHRVALQPNAHPARLRPNRGAGAPGRCGKRVSQRRGNMGAQWRIRTASNPIPICRAGDDRARFNPQRNGVSTRHASAWPPFLGTR